MNATARKLTLNLGILALIASTATLLNSCSSAQSKQSPIKIDGSSTVFPITDAIVKEYQKTQPNKVEVQVAISGTGDRKNHAVLKKNIALRVNMENKS